MTTANISNTPSSDRPIWQRWTVIGGTLLAVLNYLETQGMIPPGTATEVTAVAEHAAALLMGLGIYRHIPSS